MQTWDQIEQHYNGSYHREENLDIIVQQFSSNLDVVAFSHPEKNEATYLNLEPVKTSWTKGQRELGSTAGSVNSNSEEDFDLEEKEDELSSTGKMES